MREKNRATRRNDVGGKATDAEEVSDDDNIEEVKAADAERLFVEDEKRRREAAVEVIRKKKVKRSKKRKRPEVARSGRYSSRALDGNVLEMLDNIEEKEEEGEETRANESVDRQPRVSNPSTSSTVSSASHISFKDGFRVVACCEREGQEGDYQAGITPNIGGSAMSFLTEIESRRKRMPENGDWTRKRKIPAYNFSHPR
eukprot:15391_1